MELDGLCVLCFCALRCMATIKDVVCVWVLIHHPCPLIRSPSAFSPHKYSSTHPLPIWPTHLRPAHLLEFKSARPSALDRVKLCFSLRAFHTFSTPPVPYVLIQGNLHLARQAEKTHSLRLGVQSLSLPPPVQKIMRARDDFHTPRPCLMLWKLRGDCSRPGNTMGRFYKIDTAKELLIHATAFKEWQNR